MSHTLLNAKGIAKEFEKDSYMNLLLIVANLPCQSLRQSRLVGCGTRGATACQALSVVPAGQVATVGQLDAQLFTAFAREA